MVQQMVLKVGVSQCAAFCDSIGFGHGLPIYVLFPNHSEDLAPRLEGWLQLRIAIAFHCLQLLVRLGSE